MQDNSGELIESLRSGTATPGDPQVDHPSRIADNFDIFDFTLTGTELASIEALDTARRGGPEPEQTTLERTSPSTSTKPDQDGFTDQS